MSGPERYRTVRRIGTGGMAEVFEGVALGTGGFERRVAIKRMFADSSDEAHARMFVDEARIASFLHHGNIVGVLDYGVADGVPYQVLEYVDGTDGERLLELFARAGGALPVDVALHICTEVGHALAHVHASRDASGQPLGIVHRDVKPSNILVSWDGDVKLTDFGVAFARSKRATQTMVGMVKGTPPFMAPEQMLGAPLDGRTDVFSLGCVLHAFLTGASPLQQERVGQLLTGQELVLSRELDDDVREILAGALKPSRVARFTAEEMTRALGAALSGRLDRDAKTRMREWLRPLRQQLDRRQSPADHAPSFEIAATEVAQGGPTEPATPRPNIARRVLIGASLVLVAAAGAAAGKLLPNPPAPAPPALPVVVAPVPVPPAPLPSPPLPSPPPPTAAVAVPASHRSRKTPARAKPVAKPDEPVAPPVAPAASPPPPPPAPGTLVLRVQGEGTAKVWIDDADRGSLPYAHSFNLAPGSHHLRLERLGQTVEQREVVIEAGKTTQLPVQFGGR